MFQIIFFTKKRTFIPIINLGDESSGLFYEITLLARKLLEQFDFIFIEDLDLDAMKKEYGRKVSDLAFSKFILFLEFKAMENGKFVGKVGRFFASTKTCSSCLHKKEFMPLRERTFKCDNCGFKCGRDHNAAINIKREGASSLWLGIVSLNLGLAAPVKA